MSTKNTNSVIKIRLKGCTAISCFTAKIAHTNYELVLSKAVTPKFSIKWNFSHVEFCSNRKSSDNLVRGHKMHRCALAWLGLVCALRKVWLWPKVNFWLKLQRGWRISSWVVSWALCILFYPEVRLISGEYESTPAKITASPNENIYAFIISDGKEIECLFSSQHLWDIKYCSTKSGKWLSKNILILSKDKKKK